MKRYNPKELEPRWQKKWAEAKLYEAIDFDEKPKYVVLTEFPYPSGVGIHLGHTREYTLGDVIARHKRMMGHNVLFPMGYDEFGLPTENFAIKNKISPQKATKDNVANFQKQLEAHGFGIDWGRKVNTSDPHYYKWTQWLFLQLYKTGLAYQDEIPINWCPKCKTGLANEEVINGRHERCGTPVEKKQLKQWLLKITKYADQLIHGLRDIDFPHRIAEQQINWIGKSKGAEIDFKIDDAKEKIKVFTTRPDTLFGATFMVLAPEHPLVSQITTKEQKQKVAEYIKQAQAKSDIERQETDREKTGVFTGGYAINPVNKAKIPVWIADYVMMGYGTGAIMAVPAHDERDFDFAKKFELPIIEVIKKPKAFDGCYSGEGEILNSAGYNGMDSSSMREKIVNDLVAKEIAKEKVNYKLRDWIFSRQHYWGEPIPIVHCPKDGAVAVPDDQLPVELPSVDNYEPTDTGESPLANIKEWVNTKCPKCGGQAKRETDTMPNWAGSSWYYLRYFDPHNDRVFADKKKLQYWGMVDLYLGSMEHTTLHLLYSRFWHQFFYDQGLVPTPEPYAARRGQGIILASDGQKMSKSKGNVIDPTELINSGYGADALRVLIVFLAPYDMTTPWNQSGISGTFRFLQRVWTLTHEFLDNSSADKAEDGPLRRATHTAIKKVSEDLNSMQFNTAIAALMECTNELYKIKADQGFAARDDWRFALKTLVQLLAPFAPHIAEQLWQDLGNEGSVHLSTWPVHDEKYLVSKTITIVVQVNGKVRANIEVPAGAAKDTIIDAAKADEKVKTYLKKEARKTIYVPGKLVNFVV